jgi:hypothetical protein
MRDGGSHVKERGIGLEGGGDGRMDGISEMC